MRYSNWGRTLHPLERCFHASIAGRGGYIMFAVDSSEMMVERPSGAYGVSSSGGRHNGLDNKLTQSCASITISNQLSTYLDIDLLAGACC
jgi:hypothetical protein